MKKVILISCVSFILLFLVSCKNDKIAKSVEGIKTSVEDKAEAVSSEIESVVDDSVENINEAVIDLPEGESNVESIGSKELKELKKAEAEEARKPKVNKQKGTKPSGKGGNKPKPTKSTESQPIPEKPVPGKSDPFKIEAPKEVDVVENSRTEEESKVIEFEDQAVPDTPAANQPKPETKGVSDKPKVDPTEEPEPVGKITKPTNSGSISTQIETQSGGVNHGSFNTLLEKFVSASGEVNYSGLKAGGRSLNSYCKNLTENPPQEEWPKNEKLAFWLNAYNAFTLKLITDNFPLNSITDLHGGKPWDHSWIKIGNQTLSLNNIENDIIRPTFNDARIHFAVNCAAKSCPPLGNFAFTADNVNSKLNALTKSFVNGPYNQITANELRVSKIFEWYKSDFGNLISFINKYANTKVNADANVKFSEYDWGLNGK